MKMASKRRVLGDTLRRCCSLMSDWDSNPAGSVNTGLFEAGSHKETRLDITPLILMASVWMCVCVGGWMCVCVCSRERDYFFMPTLRDQCVCVCVCWWDHWSGKRGKQKVKSENIQTSQILSFFKRMMGYTAWSEGTGCPQLHSALWGTSSALKRAQRPLVFGQPSQWRLSPMLILRRLESSSPLPSSEVTSATASCPTRWLQQSAGIRSLIISG